MHNTINIVERERYRVQKLRKYSGITSCARLVLASHNELYGLIQ